MKYREEKNLVKFPENKFFKNYFGRFGERFGLFNLHQHISTYNWSESKHNTILATRKKYSHITH